MLKSKDLGDNLPGFEAPTEETNEHNKPQSSKKKKKGSGGFQSMGLSFPILKGITKRGYKQPTPIQRKTIPLALEGKDVVAMARTGSGKTASFVLPILEKLTTPVNKTMPGKNFRALILSPTRELALQTLKFVRELGKFTGLTSAAILGGESIEQQFSVMSGTAPDIVVATPGRFLHICIEMNLKLDNIKVIVFDEADRLFELGFGEQLQEIVARLPSSRQTLLFSATLPKMLVQFARAGLSDPILIRLDVDWKLPSTLWLGWIYVRAELKTAALLLLLEKVLTTNTPQALVFAATKHHVEYLHLILQKAGISSTYAYSGLDPSARKIALGRFTNKKCSVLLVTDVAARGLDLPALDTVINYNFPAKPKLFVHRVGEIEGLSKRQLEFVSGILTDRGFSNERVLVAAVGKADDNYAANVKRFVVEKAGETFKMVAKIAPSEEFARNKMSLKHLFFNEHVMYTYVLPKFTELEKAADVPENERFIYAKCYGSLSEEPNEIILLEDLQLSNYVMLDKTKSYTDDTVKLVLKNFAILHSLSYALKNREPETYEDFKNKLSSSMLAILQNEDLKMALSQIENSFISLLDNAKHKNKVKGLCLQMPQNAVKNFKIFKDSKYSVIQQGDSWTNNMLFKLEGDKTVQCCMLDYQISTNNSPVADIHYMIFACTDYETRSKHYHEWIDYYHAQLDKRLANFGLKANYIYPRDQLDADLKRFGKYSFAVSMMFANMLLVNTEEAVIMKEAMKDKNKGLGDVFNFSVKKDNAVFKDRVTGLVNSFIELGYV